jgi:hypothetical protein
MDNLKTEWDNQKQSYYLAFRFNASNAAEEFNKFKNNSRDKKNTFILCPMCI